MRLSLLVFALFAPFAAWAGKGPPSPVQCDEEFADCKETCVMEHGTRQATRAKFKKCMGKCSFREKDCREAVMEASRSQVEQEAIDRKAQNEDSSPYRATSKDERAEVQKKADDEKRVEDERRAEEDRRRAESQRAAEARRAGKTAEAEKPAKTERATRSETRDEAPPPKKSEPRDEPPAKKAEPREDPPPKKSEDPPPKKSEDPPPKKKAPPPDDEKPVEKKKSDKRDRALEEWDPDAL